MVAASPISPSLAENLAAQSPSTAEFIQAACLAGFSYDEIFRAEEAAEDDSNSSLAAQIVEAVVKQLSVQDISIKVQKQKSPAQPS